MRAIHLAVVLLCAISTQLPAAEAASPQTKDGGPPAGSKWKLTFSDEFNGDKLDMNAWKVENGSPGHIQSSRWAENVVVKDGLLRLLTKKETRGGKQWTTASIWTKDFTQKYGYFECRYRYGAATGLNNAFWLMTAGKKTDPVHFEIDINEGHFPERVNMNLHNWAGEHWAKHTRYYVPRIENGAATTKPAGLDLSKDFHIYSLEWTPKELIWYFDGKVIRKSEHTICHREAVVRISSAIFPWAGKITDALDGTSMDVDWVRVWAKE